MMRLFQLAVVALWLFATAWLVRSTWFPDESRFVTVEIDEVLEAMFVNWHETAELLVLEDGRQIGRMTISASNERPPPDEVGSQPSGGRLLSTTGALSEVLGTNGVADGDDQTGGELAVRQDRLFWRGLLRLDAQNRFSAGEVVLRFPENNSRIKLGYSDQSKSLQAEAVLGGMPLMRFDGPVAELKKALPAMAQLGAGSPLMPRAAMPGLKLIASELGNWLPGLAEGAGEGSDGGDAMSVDSLPDELAKKIPPITAKFGRTQIGGQRMAVYLVSIGNGDRDTTVKIYIGEDGRPLMVDTPLDYQVIAEVLVPEQWLDENSPGAVAP